MWFWLGNTLWNHRYRALVWFLGYNLNIVCLLLQIYFLPFSWLCTRRLSLSRTDRIHVSPCLLATDWFTLMEELTEGKEERDIGYFFPRLPLFPLIVDWLPPYTRNTDMMLPWGLFQAPIIVLSPPLRARVAIVSTATVLRPWVPTYSL